MRHQTKDRKQIGLKIKQIQIGVMTKKMNKQNNAHRIKLYTKTRLKSMIKTTKITTIMIKIKIKIKINIKFKMEKKDINKHKIFKIIITKKYLIHTVPIIIRTNALTIAITVKMLIIVIYMDKIRMIWKIMEKYNKEKTNK